MSDLPPVTLQDLDTDAAPSSAAVIGVQEPGGVMLKITLAALYALVGANLAGAAVITASGQTLSPGKRYPFGTSVGPLGASLPPVAGVTEGAAIDWLDADYDAGTNNITFTASGADEIIHELTSAPAFTADVNGAYGSFIARAGAWRAIVNVS